MLQQTALVIHVALAIGVIGLVLIQHGKGADAGAAFGAGASSTVFGARGSASFLTKLTTILAGLFFLTSLTLFYLAAQRDGGANQGSVTESVAVEESAAPAAAELPGGVTESDDALPAAAEEVLPKPAE